MNLKSKYRIFSCILLLALLIGVPLLTVVSVLSTKLFLNDPKKVFVLAFPLLMAITILLLVYHLRYKWDIVQIGNFHLRIKKFFGLGKEVVIEYSAIKATPSWEHVRIGNGQLIVIESNGQVVTEISDFTYSNYKDLVTALEIKTKLEEYRFRPFIERIKLVLT
ncbi:hypothetical protein [Rufibacter psychrotolerans]|uniref:hypothetical protein n=1 Tax=Rufibacter psychrotolerans TaxID=2812556 RepID=UPI00196830C0|nr:hypothetical protein [Rufibacter sp. SYSU D00308]